MSLNWQSWLGNNIAPIVGKWLKDDFGLKVRSAFSLQMQTMSDTEIYLKAKEAGNVILITRDSDIVDIVDTHGSPPKLINIKIGNSSNHFLYAILKNHIQKAIRLLTDFETDVYQIEL